jgi:hypothetical protein
MPRLASRLAPPLQDTLSREGAETLCKRLSEYWTAQGYTTHRFWVENQPVGLASRMSYRNLFVVRTNLINGLPPFQSRNG